MKSAKAAMLCVAACIGVVAAVPWGHWQTLATLRVDDGVVTLQYQTSEGGEYSNTQVRWRVLNDTTRVMRDVVLGDKTYECSNGQTISRRGEQFEHQIEPEDWEATNPDQIDPADCPAVERADLDRLDALMFRFGDDGPTLPWTEHGQVR